MRRKDMLPKPGSAAGLTDRHLTVLRTLDGQRFTFDAVERMFGRWPGRRVLDSLEARSMVRKVAVRGGTGGRAKHVYTVTDWGKAATVLAA